MNDYWYKMIGILNSETIFVPDSLGSHILLVIDSWDIIEITTYTIKIDAKIIIFDWDNRQIPRNRYCSFQKNLKFIKRFS